MVNKDKQYSQRDFAKITGLSTVTVSRMIKEGKIKKDMVTGLIPISEVNNIAILQAKHFRSKNTLAICLGHKDTTEKTAEYLTEFFTKTTKNVPFYFENEDGHIKFEFDSSDSAKSNILNNEILEEYNKRVLKKFIELYKSCVDNAFLNAIMTSAKSYPNDDEASKLSGVGYYVDLLCGKADCVINPNIKDEEKQKTISDRFSEIMTELGLVNKAGSFIFNREDLTIDFFNKKGELYEKYVKVEHKNNSDDLDNTDESGVVPAEDKHIEYLPANNKKIGAEVAAYICNKYYKDAMKNQLKYGFFTTYYVNIDTPEPYFNNLMSLLNSELFSTIMFTVTEQDYNEKTPVLLKAVFDSYISSGYNVEFAG